MVVGSASLFEEVSDYPQSFDILPKLIDGIDFVTAEYFNTLSHGTRRMTAAIGSSPLTSYDGVNFGITETDSGALDSALTILSRMDGGLVTLRKPDDSGGRVATVLFKKDIFTITSTSGSNPNVPFVTLISPYQPNYVGEGKGKKLQATRCDEYEVNYIYDDSSPYKVIGFTARVNATGNDGGTEIECAWLAMECSIG